MIIRHMTSKSFFWKGIYNLVVGTYFFIFILSGSKDYCHASQSNATTKRVRQREFLRGGNAPYTTPPPTTTTKKATVPFDNGTNGTKAKGLNEENVKWKDPVIMPPTGNHTRSVIFLHGSGDTGSGWAYMLSHLRDPSMKIICPTANEMYLNFSGQIKKTSTWFTRADGKQMYENREDMNKSNHFIHSLIDKEIEIGIDPQKIIVGGFSQGGTVAIQAATTYPKKLGGIIAMSAWLPIASEFTKNFNPVQRNITIFQGHGENDVIVPMTLANFTATVFKRVTDNHIMKVYPGIDHEVQKVGMQDIKAFLRNQTLLSP